MSLLIDALKKAEQEKKEAAKRLKEAQEKTGGRYELESRTQDRSPDQAAEQPLTSGPKTADVSEQKDQETSPAGESPDMSLSSVAEDHPGKELELTHSHEITRAEETLSEEEKPAAFELKDITLENPEIPDEDDDHEPGDENLISPDSGKTFSLAGLSDDKKAKTSFEDTANATLTGKYSKTLSESRVSRSPVSAAELARDMGGGKEVPTPVAAQTVFSAVASSAGRRQAVEWIVFLALFTMVLLAAGSFYYLKITPLTPETSSPLVAKGIEASQSPVTAMPLPEVIAPEGEETGTVTETIAPDQETQAVTEGATTEPPAQTVVAESPPAATSMPEGTVQVKPVPPESMPAESTPEKTIQETKPVETAQQTAPEATIEKTKTAKEGLPSLPGDIKVEPAAIAITRSRSVDVKDQIVNSAYALYVAGKYNEAESEYRKVLDKLPENRDALLGLAAIAYRKGDIQGAYEGYLKVIKYYPADIAAKSALIGMQGGTDPVRSESLIKVMLQENPDAAFLYFTLGNIYAKQLRWAEAQQAFFNAYRIQSSNPDYTYNLAVSLDQIGQTRTALDYYHKALELAGGPQQASFNTASVMTRINTLASISPTR